MAELQKMIQASNEAFKSDQMRSFVMDCKGQLSLGADPAFSRTGGVSTGGASFFTQPSSSPSTTQAQPSTTSAPEADNANANLLIQGGGRTDNVQTENNGNTTTTTTTTTTEGNQNTINANTTTQTTTTQTTTTSTTSGGAATEPDSNANMTEVAALLEEVRRPMPETRQVLVQQVREATVEAHTSTCINQHLRVHEARSKFMAAKEAGQLPDMSKLSLSATAMWEKMMAQLMPEMSQTMKFFKLLPGFGELCLDDQMLLIKQGTFEVMMTRFSMLIDEQKETMLDPSHQMVCPRQVILEMPMGKFLDGFFKVGARFNPVGLKDGEIGVFTAVLAFCPNRPGLKESRLVGTIQALYLRALYDLLKQNHSDAENKFSQVMGLMSMFQQMNEEHSKALTAMKMQSPETFNQQFSPVHKEMFTQ
ncbi:hypothetical protein ACOMHN_041300 [Nucella lapillus]